MSTIRIAPLSSATPAVIDNDASVDLERGAASRQTTRELMRKPAKAGEDIPKSDVVRPGASLTFKDLTFSATLPTGEEKTILEPCSGHFESGQLVAIMGPSGCGKSTLLDMLAMKKTAPYDGQVFVNGQARDARLFQRIAAYVGQEDLMPEHWRVREALQFNECLKGQSQMKRRGAVDRSGGLVDSLLEAFGLADVAESYIGGPSLRGISGGQRRRVSLARGVVARASLLFCDEPTSGLSATDAELCVRALRVVAKRMGTLVLVVIHQPRKEVAELFDTLVLLTSNPGRMTYCGPMAELSSYMESCGYPVPAPGNATDFVLDLLTPGSAMDASAPLVGAFASKQKALLERTVEDALETRGQTAQEMLREAAQQQEAAASGNSSSKARLGAYAVPFHRQVRVLLRRKVLVTLRNPGAFGMQTFVPIVMGFVLGAIFKGIGSQSFGLPQISFVFILLTMLGLQSMSLMPLFIDERTVMKYETSEKLYAESAQILTSLCVTVPLSLIGATCSTLVIFAFTGLSYDLLPVLLGWTLLLFCFFDAVFACCAAVAPDGQQAQSLAIPFLVIFMLFNGSVVTRNTSPDCLKWIFAISPTSYALQAIVIPMAQQSGPNAQGIIDMMGFRAGEDVQGIVIIACMTLMLRVLQVYALKCCNNLQR